MAPRKFQTPCNFGGAGFGHGLTSTMVPSFQVPRAPQAPRAPSFGSPLVPSVPREDFSGPGWKRTQMTFTVKTYADGREVKTYPNGKVIKSKPRRKGKQGKERKFKPAETPATKNENAKKAAAPKRMLTAAHDRVNGNIEDNEYQNSNRCEVWGESLPQAKVRNVYKGSSGNSNSVTLGGNLCTRVGILNVTPRR